MPASLMKDSYIEIAVPVSLYKMPDGGGNKVIFVKQLPVGTVIVKPAMGGMLDPYGSGRTLLNHEGGFVYEDEVMKRGNYKNLGYNPITKNEDSSNDTLKTLGDIISKGIVGSKINTSSTKQTSKNMKIYKVVAPYTIGTYINNLGIKTSAEAFAPKVGDKVEGVIVDNPMPQIGGKIERGIVLPIKFTIAPGRESSFEQFIPESSLQLVDESQPVDDDKNKAVNPKPFPYKKVVFIAGLVLAIYGGYKILN